MDHQKIAQLCYDHTTKGTGKEAAEIAKHTNLPLATVETLLESSGTVNANAGPWG